ncbi:RNA polymerase factor sigma-54 [Halieaceae bacterium IMCC14734]|uniref:RNA polymerase sigma-54 factor n=1 Tax=Candidatus Litorirhabdus singularis TaxID=2518993 RepID=A0ABT3TM99_9GAMM|nr:RNA polymerase factor sigma-54 [Candidatus Litorirhabdus singularis]MCX2982457.1 RNA polymerase factor sigma-54 [Candidatus Litorirhabdus singularis]
MKQSLQLKLGQQLTMTPQLQQAIRLLQLSTLDLQQEIQQALDSNPMLEVPDFPDEGGDSTDGNNETPSPEATSEQAGPEELMELAQGGESLGDTIPDDLPVDTQWEDVYQAPVSVGSGGSDYGDNDYDGRLEQTETLQERLSWQLNLTRFSDLDRYIAVAIIDATNNMGRLSVSAEKIWEGFDPELEIELDEVMAVLHRLQQFDPPGVCTHDLQECLLVQLRQLPETTEHLAQAKMVVSRHITLLATRDYAQLMRRARLREPELKAVLELIQTLTPNPGENLGDDGTEYIVPDVFVSRRGGTWVVELNPDIAPKIRINAEYAGLVKRANSSADNTYLRDNLQEARWFLKSLQSRNETLMKVATKIVERQRGFLEFGAEAMKPLVLHDIADAIEMHESTISRVTTQKYMHTPRGIFELKYFFSSHVNTAAGGECSSTAIRALIRKLVDAENPRKPLSDNKITSLLEDQGIKVARRTIAKYRESLSIPPSNERKQLV